MYEVLSRLVVTLRQWASPKTQKVQEIRHWQKLTSADIEAMHANEFQKDEFRKMLADAKAAKVILGCLGELTPNGLQLAVVDPSDSKNAVCFEPNNKLSNIHYNSIINASSRQRLGRVLELKAGSNVTLAVAAEKALRYEVEMLRGKIDCNGEVLTYHRSDVLNVWDPYAFLNFRKPDFTHFVYEGCTMPEVMSETLHRFRLPEEIGALFSLIAHDVDTLPPHLREVNLTSVL